MMWIRGYEKTLVSSFFIFMNQVRERVNFLKTFVSDKNVGAITVSSRFVIKNIMKHMRGSVHTVIECGPGEGVLTRALLKDLSPQGILLGIEANKKFASFLHGIHDSRLRIAEGKAQDIIIHATKNNIGAADLIVASIPFSFLTPLARLRMVRDAHKLLASKGKFIIFNYSPLMYRTMKEVFGNVSLSVEMRNIPPCFIMVAQKRISQKA